MEGLSWHMPTPSKELWKRGKPLTPQENAHPRSFSVQSDSPTASAATALCVPGCQPGPCSWWSLPGATVLCSATQHAKLTETPFSAAAAFTISCIATAMSLNRSGAEGVSLWLYIAGILRVNFSSTDLCLVG